MAIKNFFITWFLGGCISMLLMFLFYRLQYQGFETSILTPILIGFGGAISNIDED